jgi:flagellar protein FlbT
VVRNGDTRARLFIEGTTPIMRERDIMGVEVANTPAKRIYFVLQLMYLDRDVNAYRGEFLSLIEDFMNAVPSAWKFIKPIADNVIQVDIYKAIKSAKDLIDYETELLSHDTSRDDGLRTDRSNRNKQSRTRSESLDEISDADETRSRQLGSGSF